MNIKNKKVLVTGADGFMGSHLTEQLVERGAKVRALVYYNSNNSWGWLDHAPKSVLSKIDVFCGDVRDPNGVETAISDRDIVFHLAALIGIPYSYQAPDNYVDTNIKGTLNVLQACRKHKMMRIICTSTSEVYGTAQYVPIDENHPLRPQSPYAATKVAADELALSFYRSFDLPVTILRPFNTFGPRQSARAIIPTVISQYLSDQPTIKLGNLNATRDLNYVLNTVNAFIRLAETTDSVGEVFNYGSGKEITIEDLVKKIGDILKINKKIKIDSNRLRPPKSEVERLLCDASKLRKACDLGKEVTLEEGLKATCQFVKQHQGLFKSGIYNV